jgi:hypothetical protein
MNNTTKMGEWFPQKEMAVRMNGHSTPPAGQLDPVRGVLRLAARPNP